MHLHLSDMKLVSGWGESLVELVHGPAARNGLSARGSSALQLASFVLPFLALGPVVRMMDWEIEEDTHRTQMNSEPFVSHFQNAWAQDPHPGNFVLMPSGKIGHSAAEVLGWSWFAQHIIFIEMCKVDQSWWCKALQFLRNLGLWPDDPHLWRQAGGTYSISYACLLLRGTAVDWKNYTFAAFGCNRQRCNFLWMGGFRLITHDQFVWGPSKHVWRARSQSYHRMSFFELFRRLRFELCLGAFKTWWR